MTAITIDIGRQLQNVRTLAIIVFILLCLIWGSTWLVIRIGLQEAPPFLSAGMRFFIAASLLYVLMKLKGLKFPKDKKILWLMVSTGTFAVSVAYGLVYWAEQYVSAGLTAVLFSTSPFFVLIYSHFVIADDRFTLKKVLGSLLGFSGVILVYLDSLRFDNQLILLGTSAIILSALFTAVSNVTVKRNFHSLNPIILSVAHMVCGAVTLLLVGFIFERTADFNLTFKSIGSILYLAIIGSCVGFIGYYWLIREIRVSAAALVVLVIPVVALFLDWLILDEVLHWRILAGSALVVTGVGVAIR